MLQASVIQNQLVQVVHLWSVLDTQFPVHRLESVTPAQTWHSHVADSVHSALRSILMSNYVTTHCQGITSNMSYRPVCSIVIILRLPDGQQLTGYTRGMLSLKSLSHLHDPGLRMRCDHPSCGIRE